jgi:O-antigen/teichoic acid export membrane protein
MDSSTKRRLALGFLSNWISKLAGIIVQLVQVPVFLHFWGVPLYGEWMIVTAVPTYLQISNFGFGSVAGNEMAMMTARGDREGALRTFQSCWWLITIICTTGILLLGIAVYLLPAGRYLRLHAIGDTDTKWILFYLGCAILLAQLESLLQSAYRCVGRYPYGAFLKSMFSLTAYGLMLVPVALGAGARVTALVFAIANVFFTGLMCVLVRRDIPWIRFGFRHASFAEIRRLTNPAFAFMAFPIGNALNLQGTLMAVGYALGPTSVVIFGTARTVSRVAFQIVQMVNNTFWPEISAAFGSNDIGLTRTLHRRCCQMALGVSLATVTAMMTLGPWFLNRWTGGHVPPSRGLLAVLLVVAIANALWSTSSTLLAAINRHQRLAAWYLFGTSITVICTYLLARYVGLYWAAASLLISELVMNLYVLPTSLKLSHDTLSGFLGSLTHVPQSLRPAALMARLRQTSVHKLAAPEESF